MAIFDFLSKDKKNDTRKLVELPVASIVPNPNQPRKSFDEDSIAELAKSIEQVGLIQPLMVRMNGQGYELIAGERRLRAVKSLGYETVSCIVCADMKEEDSAIAAVIENLQREDLNPVEEACGYRDLIEGCGLTQEDAAKKVGKSRAEVSNVLRLLKLPDCVLSLVRDGKLSYGHARALLPLTELLTEQALLAHANGIISNGLSVRETEKLVKSVLENRGRSEKPKAEKSYYRTLENRVSEQIGRRVTISGNRLSLAYSGSEDLEALIKSLCGNTFFEE